MNQGIDQDLANRRAAALVARLLRDHGLTRNDIKTHKQWTGKTVRRCCCRSGRRSSPWSTPLASTAAVADGVAPPSAGCREGSRLRRRISARSIIMRWPFRTTCCRPPQPPPRTGSSRRPWRRCSPTERARRKPESRALPVSERDRLHRAARDAAERVQARGQRTEEPRGRGGTGCSLADDEIPDYLREFGRRRPGG